MRLTCSDTNEKVVSKSIHPGHFFTEQKGMGVDGAIEIEKGSQTYAHVYKSEMWNLGQNR